MPVFTQPLANRTFDVDVHTVDLLVPPASPTTFPRPQVFPRLRPYQELAARHLVGQKHAALLADYGLGRIEVASEVAPTYLVTPEVERVIILARSSQVTNWAYLTHAMGFDDVWVPSGPPGPRWRNYTTCAARFYVVPYSLLTRDIEVLLPLMPSSLLILDDVSKIRRPAAQRTLDALRLRTRAAATLTLIQSPHQYEMDEWSHVIWSAVDPFREDRDTTRALARHLRGMTPPAGVVTVTAR